MKAFGFSGVRFIGERIRERGRVKSGDRFDFPPRAAISSLSTIKLYRPLWRSDVPERGRVE